MLLNIQTWRNIELQLLNAQHKNYAIKTDTLYFPGIDFAPQSSNFLKVAITCYNKKKLTLSFKKLWLYFVKKFIDLNRVFFKIFQLAAHVLLLTAMTNDNYVVDPDPEGNLQSVEYAVRLWRVSAIKHCSHIKCAANFRVRGSKLSWAYMR
jgi:hypothetical protein